MESIQCRSVLKYSIFKYSIFDIFNAGGFFNVAKILPTVLIRILHPTNIAVTQQKGEARKYSVLKANI